MIYFDSVMWYFYFYEFLYPGVADITQVFGHGHGQCFYMIKLQISASGSGVGKPGLFHPSAVAPCSVGVQYAVELFPPDF